MIETSRLTLRPFIPEDERVAIPLLMCKEFMAYSPTGALDAGGAKQRFFELIGSYRQNGLGKLAIVVKSSGALVGYCGIEMCEIDGTEKPELGFRLLASHRGMGYATEAATAVLKRAESFSKSVIAFTEPANKPSMRVLEKLGFMPIGESSFEGMLVVVFKRDG